MHAHGMEGLSKEQGWGGEKRCAVLPALTSKAIAGLPQRFQG